MTASTLVEGTAPGAPLALLVLIVLVLAAFGIASAVVWAIGRLEDWAWNSGGREVLRHADDLGSVSDRDLRKLRDGEDVA